MPYHVKRHETISEAIKRVAREEMDTAASHLSHPPSNGEGVHEARKSVKKTRALLRLVRFELDAVYGRENRALREIGRQLSPLRDSVALIETFDDLRTKHSEGVNKSVLSAVRHLLVSQKEQTEKEAQLNQLAPAAAKSLRAVAERIEAWPLKGTGFAAIRDGVEAVFRGARRSMRQAQKHPDADHFHEWRKRVKDHWYFTRLMEDLWPEVMSAERETLHSLEQFLGDDHNLAVLSKTLRAEKQFKPLRKAIEKYQKELRGAANTLGERVYSEKPSEFVKRTEHLWDLWRAEPEEVKELLKEQASAVQ